MSIFSQILHHKTKLAWKKRYPTEAKFLFRNPSLQAQLGVICLSKISFINFILNFIAHEKKQLLFLLTAYVLSVNQIFEKTN